MKGAVRITKKEWYARGGFKNFNLFRRGTKNGGWKYYMIVDNE